MLATFKSVGPVANACRARSPDLSRYVRSSLSRATALPARFSARRRLDLRGHVSISPVRRVLAEMAAATDHRRHSLTRSSASRIASVVSNEGRCRWRAWGSARAPRRVSTRSPKPWASSRRLRSMPAVGARSRRRETAGQHVVDPHPRELGDPKHHGQKRGR